MKTKRETEYAVEMMNEDGDIIDQNCFRSLAEAKADFDATTRDPDGEGRTLTLSRWLNVWKLYGAPTDAGRWADLDSRTETELFSKILES